MTRQMKQYNYLVSFYCGNSGFGIVYITRTSKLDSFNKLTELAEWIGEHNSVSNVAISSFQLVNISRVKKGEKVQCQEKRLSQKCIHLVARAIK